MNYIKWLSELSQNLDVELPLVGAKNAALGILLKLSLSTQSNFKVPNGFAVTTNGYWHYLNSQNIKEPLERLVSEITNTHDIAHVQKISDSIRELIGKTPLPDDLREEITQAYMLLSKSYGVQELDVAVRSSALSEDMPGVSAAGQYESFLAVQSANAVIDACKQCFASLFSPRALIYTAQINSLKNLETSFPALAVCVQKMVRSDCAVAGVAFSVETESGCKDFITIASSHGLGQLVVQGAVIPDEFYVYKQKLKESFDALVYKRCGSKESKLVYAGQVTHTLVQVPVDPAAQQVFSLGDMHVLAIARAVLFLEQHYLSLTGQQCFLDVEWAYDGLDGQLYIVQVRPETVHSVKNNTQRACSLVYKLEESRERLLVLAQGQAVGKKIAQGTARVISSLDNLIEFNEGDILVTPMTDPDWMPLLQKAGGIITNSGGRTCHAAIVSRELGIPALVGTHTATQTIASGRTITLDCSQGLNGYVYDGILSFSLTEPEINVCEYTPPVDILINLADPAQACRYATLPVAGIGLARLEFIIAHLIGIHPLAIAHYDELADHALRDAIRIRAAAYNTPQEFFIETLSQGMGLIAAAFYPRPVIVRLTDFKSNEYAGLLGGSIFEKPEENPMLGFRGAARYISAAYRPAFALECAALLKARETMGLDNIIIMVPFVRTLHEAEEVLKLLEFYGLKRGQAGLKIYMMVEVPSNVLLIEDFALLFDGFSIGSNDLTQLTLGVDRDSAVLANLFDERDPAVRIFLRHAVEGARRAGKPIGICGQAPSDYPELIEYLLRLGITSLSLNPDTVYSCLEWLFRNWDNKSASTANRAHEV